jgi:hypothetical protein
VHRSLLASPLAVALVAALAPVAAAEPPQLHVETDPLPLIQGGYGLQAGVRPAGTPWRIAVASFSLDVPDPAVQVGGNDGFHLRVRPSAALYVLRYFPGRSGWLVGGSLRYLRLRYTHDDAPGAHGDLGTVSPEVIAGYHWHPTPRGLLRPAVGRRRRAGVDLGRRGRRRPGLRRPADPAVRHGQPRLGVRPPVTLSARRCR